MPGSTGLQNVPGLTHTHDPGAAEKSPDRRAQALEGWLLVLSVGIIHTVGTPLPLGTGPGIRPAGGRPMIPGVGVGAGEAESTR